MHPGVRARIVRQWCSDCEAFYSIPSKVLLRSLVLILIVEFGLLGLAEGVATAVRKGAKDAGKAEAATARDAAQGTSPAAKDVVHAPDRTVTPVPENTRSALRKTAGASKRSG